MLHTYLERIFRLALTLLVIWLALGALRGLTPGIPLPDGLSLVTGRPAAEIAGEALQGYALAVAWAMLYALPVALLLGVPAGLRPGSPVDRLLQVPALLLMGVPMMVGVLVSIKLLAMDAGWLSISGAGTVAIALIGGGWLARAVRSGLADARDHGAVLRKGPAVRLVLGRLLQQTGNMLMLTLLLTPGGFTGAAVSQALMQSVMSRDIPVTAAVAGGLLGAAALAHLIGDLLVTSGARFGRPAARPALRLLLPGLALGSILIVTTFLTFGETPAIFSAGARTSLIVAAGATLIGAVGGGFLGLIGGLTGRWGGALLSPRVETPTLLAPYFAVIIVSSIAGPGLTALMIAIGLAGIPAMAYPVRRLIAAPTGPQRDGLFFGAMGALLLLFAQSLMAETIAGMMGLGVAPPSASIGGVLAGIRPLIRTAPHLFYVAIPVALSFGGLLMAGHALADAAGSEREGASLGSPKTPHSAKPHGAAVL